MHFRTALNISDVLPKIELQTQLLSLGSCFSDEMGQKMERYKFKIQHNPFGIPFNPISIFKILQQSLSNSEIHPQHFVQQHERWVHFDYHSELHASTSEQLKATLKQQLAHTQAWLQNTQVLILTFGTAWVHVFKQSEEIVANCHKVPQKQFSKRLLTLEEMMNAFAEVRTLLPSNIQILLTVSPVRHLKEGLANNQISKSLLRIFCHQLAEKHTSVHYFPSYELMLDDLRDYRFFKEDLIHPTEFALDYVWEKFQQAHFTPDTLSFIKEWKKILTALEHKAFNPTSKAHQDFLRKLLKKLESFSSLVNIEEERQLILAQLQ